jgi:AraC-like DNA-binding protein
MTRPCIKQVASSLQFADQLYFSRFFKKLTGVSLQALRNWTDMLVVAATEYVSG